MVHAKIYVAAHRVYSMPVDDLYQPILVGAANQAQVPAGYLADNVGPNISAKNPNYSELTAIYWLWHQPKDNDIVGLVHYRRYLGLKGGHDWTNRLSVRQIEALLADHDLILPKARNYWIENQRNHYLHAHAAAPYQALAKVLRDDYPSYYPAFTELEKSTRAHLFNMFIMPRPLFDQYAAFVFGVLDQVAAQIDLSQLQGQEQRVFGYLSELLMDTWVNTKQLRVAECPVINLEKTNWLDKGYQFLKRKFLPNSKKKVHF
ncbi:DUF4422 domain-containing protein [Lactobacillaceae bacterium L1_55_11]|nr:DUF4422 domain-containing protein [Lactobacillaceae bacterium L1_55_11]